MSGIFTWIRGMIAFLLLIGLLLQLLPDGSYRKYLRFFAGLVLMILICQPILKLEHLDEWLWEQAERLGFEQEQAGLLEEISLAEGGFQERLLEEYQELIRTQVEEAAGRQGYQVRECQAQLVMDSEAEDYGTVESLSLVLSPTEVSVGVPIEPVQIGERETESGKTVPEELRQELLLLYELEPSALWIQVRE